MRTLLSMIALSVAMTACGDAAVGGGDVIEIDGGADTGFDGGADVGSDSFGDASDSGFDVQTDSGGTDSASDVNGGDSATDAEVEDAFLDSGDAETDTDGSGSVEIMVDPSNFVLNVNTGRIAVDEDLDTTRDGDYETCITITGSAIPEFEVYFVGFIDVSSINVISGTGEDFNLRNFTIITEDQNTEEEAEEMIVESWMSRENYNINREIHTIRIKLNNEGIHRPMTICEVEVFTAE